MSSWSSSPPPSSPRMPSVRPSGGGQREKVSTHVDQATSDALNKLAGERWKGAESVAQVLRDMIQLGFRDFQNNPQGSPETRQAVASAKAKLDAEFIMGRYQADTEKYELLMEMKRASANDPQLEAETRLWGLATSPSIHNDEIRAKFDRQL